jgi:hypothetical protein
MGGHQSKNTSTSTNQIYGESLLSSAKSCVNVANGSNVINITGAGNVLNGINQSLSIEVNAPCVSKTVQNSDFNNTFANAVQQKLSDSGVAMTQWMGAGSDTVRNLVTNNVNNKTINKSSQNCLNTINSQNILNINGTGNVATNIVQTSTGKMLANCLSGNAQAASAINAVTNAANQTTIVKEANPLAFLTDIFTSFQKDGMMVMAAIAFIIIICFVGIFLLVHHESSKRREDNDEKVKLALAMRSSERA